MSISAALIEELKQEAEATKKVLERIPEKTFDWKPHKKSMSMVQLASHVANAVSWAIPTLELEELDIPTDHQPWKAESTKDLIEHFETNVKDAIARLEGYPDEKMMQDWTGKSGGKVFFTLPRVAILRSFVLNHLVHHRGQLSVYLRLNDIPVPSIYGPSADEGNV
jgi:uncharacterized damage-inducible protein DinB